MDNDLIHNPGHYTHGDIECIDAIYASMSAPAFSGFLKGNCMKYLWRYEHKGMVEDLRKHRVYSWWLLLHEQGRFAMRKEIADEKGQ